MQTCRNLFNFNSGFDQETPTSNILFSGRLRSCAVTLSEPNTPHIRTDEPKNVDSIPRVEQPRKKVKCVSLSNRKYFSAARLHGETQKSLLIHNNLRRSQHETRTADRSHVKTHDQQPQSNPEEKIHFVENGVDVHSNHWTKSTLINSSLGSHPHAVCNLRSRFSCTSQSSLVLHQPTI